MVIAQKWMTLGAKKKYTVTFNLNGGKIGENAGPIVMTVNHGAKIGKIKPADPYKQTTDSKIYPFISWDKSDDTRVTSDMTVTAVYSTEFLLDYFESNNTADNGDYTFIPGIYEIKVVGAGGGGAATRWLGSVTTTGTNCYAAGGGGSGALVVGQVTLLTNTKFTIGIGAAKTNSTLKSGTWLNIDVPHGGNGSTWYLGASGGAGGAATSIVSTGLTNPVPTSGNAGGYMSHASTWDGDYGAWADGGASPISGTTHGAGGSATAAFWSQPTGAGEPGYILIHKVGELPKVKVTFLDGNGDPFKTVLNVIKGTLLTAIKPSTNPTKLPTDTIDYVFREWDKADNYEINEDTVVNPLFDARSRILFDSGTPQIDTPVTLDPGNYLVIMVGGSGESVWIEWQITSGWEGGAIASGGSGACFVGTLSVATAQTFKVTVGTGYQDARKLKTNDTSAKWYYGEDGTASILKLNDSAILTVNAGGKGGCYSADTSHSDEPKAGTGGAAGDGTTLPSYMTMTSWSAGNNGPTNTGYRTATNGASPANATYPYGKSSGSANGSSYGDGSHGYVLIKRM